MSLTRTLIKTRVPIHNKVDVVVACQKGRMLAQAYGFSTNEQYITVTAISEVAHNIVNYAQRGEIALDIIEQGKRCAILIVATDSGPGIPDVPEALKDGYSTGAGLGLGLSGAKRLMDEFEIVSEVGKGTTVTMWKWRNDNDKRIKNSQY